MAKTATKTARKATARKAPAKSAKPASASKSAKAAKTAGAVKAAGKKPARKPALHLNVLKPSVNNMAVRVFVRAAGLDFTESDVWGSTRSPEFLARNPAHLTPMLEDKGLPGGALWESCAIMQYLSNKHGLEKFYPKAVARRAMVDSAMFYLIGTLYPYVARATYPKLGFPQYAGEVGASDLEPGHKSAAQRPRLPTSGWRRRSNSWRPSITRCRLGRPPTWRL
jgi:glutathione S-transferase